MGEKKKRNQQIKDQVAAFAVELDGLECPAAEVIDEIIKSAKERVLLDTDRCVRCGHQARVLLILLNGEQFLFCGGHFENVKKKKLKKSGAVINDYRGKVIRITQMSW